MLKTSIYLFAIPLLVSLAGCTGNNKKPPVKKSAAVYADFKIKGEEGNKYVNCLFQFKPGGVEAAPVGLVAPAFVSLNGQKLTADSSKYAGVFYEAALVADSTATENKITYHDGKMTYEESFSLQPFTIGNKLPESISRKSFSIRLQPVFPGNDSIRVLLTDTAFLNADVNELAPVQNGVVAISSEVLLNLKNGPVHLELLHEKTLPLKKGLKGRLFTSYSLKREFLLVD